MKRTPPKEFVIHYTNKEYPNSSCIFSFIKLVPVTKSKLSFIHIDYGKNPNDLILLYTKETIDCSNLQGMRFLREDEPKVKRTIELVGCDIQIPIYEDVTAIKGGLWTFFMHLDLVPTTDSYRLTYNKDEIHNLPTIDSFEIR